MNVFPFRRAGGSRVPVWAVFCALGTLTQMATLAQPQAGGQGPSAGQLGSSSSNVNSTQLEAEFYWTPQRLINAKPVELHPRVGVNGLPEAPQAAPVGSAIVRAEGSRPIAGGVGLNKTLIPEVYLQTGSPNDPNIGIAPNATSSFGAHFTTYRAFPPASITAYPTRTAGKLFFSDPRTGDDYECSAATLQRRLVVTAGHCVASPSTNASQRYFYTNFLFVPGYSNGNAPIGSWSASAVWVTNAWYFSNGSVPNPQDVGMLVMRDNSGQTIGAVTGWLGYITNRLSNNHATMLGYPGNLDGGERLQINHSQTFANGGSNTFLYGSAMRGGSSGGPWVQDYGVNPGSNPVVALGRNYLISVTSYGPTATEPKYQGASNLDSRFITLRNNACGAASTGNCQ